MPNFDHDFSNGVSCSRCCLTWENFEYNRNKGRQVKCVPLGREEAVDLTFDEKLIRAIIKKIGDNPDREGLLETPARVVKSWNELYSGYSATISNLFKVFDEPCDEMVIIKDIEFYSMCEHHMMPFFGKAAIGYLPNGKVIGASKLPRLLEVFSRKLQIQERLTRNITNALDTHLEPKGSACLIEAKHFCMVCRGVQKQNSVMVTSSLTGVFKEDIRTRSEFMALVKG